MYQEIKKLWPEIEVIASHELTREWREYERTNTTVLCAYVKPIAKKYLDNLHSKLKESNFTVPILMLCNRMVE